MKTIKELRNGMILKKNTFQICYPNNKPSIEKETASTALINGNNSLGKFS